MSQSTHSLKCVCLYSYVSTGNARDAADIQSQNLIYALKDGVDFDRGSPYAFVARTLSSVGAAWNPESILVPLPRATLTPSNPTSELWPAYRLCNALLAAKLGHRVATVLRRTREVQSSKRARSLEERPSVEDHITSLKASPPPVVGPFDVVLVDDVATRGSTLMAGMLALQQAGWTGGVSAFAAARTIFPDGRRESNCPCTITWTVGQHAALMQTDSDANFLTEIRRLAKR